MAAPLLPEPDERASDNRILSIDALLARFRAESDEAAEAQADAYEATVEAAATQAELFAVSEVDDTGPSPAAGNGGELTAEQQAEIRRAADREARARERDALTAYLAHRAHLRRTTWEPQWTTWMR